MTYLCPIAIFTIAAMTGCRPRPVTTVTGGEEHRGRQLIAQFSCGSCHTIPGIQGAEGVVGPPLFFFAKRTFIAGQVPNTPENLVRWIMSPRTIEENTAMPELGLTEQQARDVAAYLYTLRTTGGLGAVMR